MTDSQALVFALIILGLFVMFVGTGGSDRDDDDD